MQGFYIAADLYSCILGVFRYYCTVCGKGQPGPKKFVQHMLKQHNIENPEIPKPFEELAPEPLIQQHKAVVQAETAARLARAANNLKKEREKGQKIRRISTGGTEQEMIIDAQHGQVTLTPLSSIGISSLQTVPAPALISTPVSDVVSSDHQQIVQSRANVEALYAINHHTATSPQFQMTRHVSESMVRHMSESMLRENLARENLARENLLRTDALSRESLARQGLQITEHLTTVVSEGDSRLRLTTADETSRHLVESPHLTNENLRRHLAENGAVVQEVQVDDPAHLALEAEGNIAVSHAGRPTAVHLFPQSAIGNLPGNLQFTTLLNSDLIAIGETVVRNQAQVVPTMFQKFGAPQ